MLETCVQPHCDVLNLWLTPDVYVDGPSREPLQLMTNTYARFETPHSTNAISPWPPPQEVQYLVTSHVAMGHFSTDGLVSGCTGCVLCSLLEDRIAPPNLSQHRQVAFSSGFQQFPYAWHAVGDFGNVSAAVLLSVTRWSEVLLFSMPVMAKVHTNVSKDSLLTFCTTKKVKSLRW